MNESGPFGLSGEKDAVPHAATVAADPGGSRPSKRIKNSDSSPHVVSSSSSSFSSANDSSSRVSSPCNNVAIRGTAAADDENFTAAAGTCLGLLFATIPASLTSSTPPKNDFDKMLSSFRELWITHGFRTSMVTSPRPAVSIYLDSCNDKGGNDGTDNARGRAYLQSCIGLHPHQSTLEIQYSNYIKDIYCLMLFVKMMRFVRKGDMEDARMKDILSPWEQSVNELLKDNQVADDTLKTNLHDLANSTPNVLSRILAKLAEIDHSLRSDQLLHEYNRIVYENCTLANACIQRWLLRDDEGANRGTATGQRYELDEVYFKPSPPGRYLPKYERITMYLKDPNAVEHNNGKLIFLPSLTQILTRQSAPGAVGAVSHPLDSVVEDMIISTWQSLLRSGYFVDRLRKEQLGSVLRQFYMSGLLAGKDANMPILLNAHFTPTFPLSLYLHGTAGSGKSSLVRSLVPAVNSAISTHCDPELVVRFVKFNLNKPMNTLQLELELRPNNNDYSVMSIIQGRRMTLSQSKPGLVMVALEEMPSNVHGADPKQADIAKLISMRFSGRKGQYNDKEAEAARARNSTKRGISGDATIISIFTSNYELEPGCMEALKRLDMFKNLTIVKVAPLAKDDRMAFSTMYVTQRVKESLGPSRGRKVNFRLDIPCGEGDIRPLVRYLRMLAFYIQALLLDSKHSNSDDGIVGARCIEVLVSQNASTKITTITTGSGDMMQLKYGSFSILYALKPPALDPRASKTVADLLKLHPNFQSGPELSQILDFYFAGVIAPAVIVSETRQLVSDLVKVLARSDEVQGIADIDPANYKMMKSLYDSTNTLNLRDDILDIVRSGNDKKGRVCVAVELVCRNTDAQLQIREIIEDTPHRP